GTTGSFEPTPLISHGADNVSDIEALAAQPQRVTRRRRTEHTRVFAAELRSAFVTDGVGRASGVRIDHHDAPRFLQTEHLLVLQRAHGRSRLEVTMERCRAHPGNFG